MFFYPHSIRKRDSGGSGEAKIAAAEAETQATTTRRIEEAVSTMQKETRRKYRGRVSEVEAAFAQLAADNRRLRARVAQLAGLREEEEGGGREGRGDRGRDEARSTEEFDESGEGNGEGRADEGREGDRKRRDWRGG